MGWVDTTQLGSGDTAVFRIVITNEGLQPLYDIYVEDWMSDSLAFYNADPYPDYWDGYGYMQWYFPGPLAFGETITIMVYATVVGTPGEIDENYVEAYNMYTSDYDYAYVEIIGATGLNLEKYVRTRSMVAEWTISLEDSFGDGWNGCYLDIYVNDVLVYGGLTLPDGAGPESYPITVVDGDVIFVDFTPGSWAYEPIWYLTDALGNVIFYETGSYDYYENDQTVTADIGDWVDDAYYATGDTAKFLITIANEGLAGYVDIDVYDYMSDSLMFVNADPYPDYQSGGYMQWYFPALGAGETINIIIWATVVGQIGEIDENYAEAYTMGLYDYDWAYVHIVDLTAPVTTHAFTGTMGDNDWYVSDVTITLTATDDYSGIAYTMYSLDGDDFVPYTDDIVVPDEGEHDIRYYSADTAGNIEDIKGPFGFKIDQTAPVTTHTIAGTMGDNDWYISDVTITLTATDATSGVGETFYKLDSGAWTVYAEPVVVSTDGQHQFFYNSSDNAGNMEATNGPFGFKMDKTAPVWVNYTFTATNAMKSKWLCSATVNDPTSGIVIVEFYVDDALVGNDTTGPAPYEFEYEGKPQNNSQALAYDAAGNSALSPIAQYIEFSAQQFNQQQVDNQQSSTYQLTQKKLL